uniref:Semialdehyde dehydrogenase NAD-binding domain-containing protein n=1 Tax=Glossina austeni TaxID=7395 RepID=A0A1A9UKF2_GLOAU
MKCIGFIGWRGLVGSVLIQQILIELDIIISCQGNSYTKIVHNKLRKLNWQGYWIDSASILRMHKSSCIVLEPVNYNIIKKKISQGYKDFIGSNCSVSLMLIALGGLFKEKLIEWISVSTYQAATGAGSTYTRQLLLQINKIHDLLGNKLTYNVIPWIGKKIKCKQSLEEKKYQEEVCKILDLNRVIPIDGICVRILSNHNSWVKIIPDDPEKIINRLTPIKIAGSLYIAIGRIRKLSIGGDQLLWGAAEPLRRILRQLIT